MSDLAAFDEKLRSEAGAVRLAGVDEAGRGPLAGPVVAAAVVLPPRPEPLYGARDSKLLTPARRESLFAEIRRHALAVGVGWAHPGEIDRDNILRASLAAMRRAVDRLGDWEGLLVVVDGDKSIPALVPRQRAVVDGDARSLSTACASIVAKVVRDRWMDDLDRRHPGYGFSTNRGYGTAEHLAALGRLGPSPIHRRSFAPVAACAR